MSRFCEITGKKPMVGHTVSHANNKTKRRFLPNLQEASFFSPVLKRNISVTCTASGIRTVEHKGGIDSYLLSTSVTKLQTAALRKARKQLVEKLGDDMPKFEKKTVRSKPSPRALKKKAAKSAA